MEMPGVGGAARHEDALLGDDGDLWDDLLVFSAPMDVPIGPKRPSGLEHAALTSLDADMAAFSPPLGVKVQHFGGDMDSWTLDGHVTNTATPSKEEAAAFDQSEKPQVDHLVDISVGVPFTGPRYDARFAVSTTTPWGQEDAVKTAIPAAPPSVPMPAAQAPPSSLTWANPTPALMQLGAKQLPNAGAMEIRRMKNRECMRRARQRQRDELKRMKATVESLEKQYAELCLRAEADSSSGSKAVPSSPSSPSSALSASSRAAQQQAQLLYAKAVEVAKQLGAENLFLRAAIQDKSAWKQHLHHILETVPSYVKSSGMHVNSAFGSPQAMPVRMACLPLDIMDPDAARSIFGFLPLTEADVTALILDNRHQMHNVWTQLETGLRVGNSRVSARQVFGWDVVQRVTQSGIMEFMFTKRFSGLSASEIMNKTWANDMELEKFRKVKFDVKRLEVLQEANANAYILGRDVRAPDKSTVFRSVFLRYLIATSQTLPNPRNNRSELQSELHGSDSESEEKDAPPLKASGFILGTHSTNRDWSQPGDASSNVPKLLGVGPTGFDTHETLVWADLALSIEFLDVEDPETGETFQRVRWIGRTDYKDSADALRNATDTLTGCLRWELLMISPALNLVSLKLS